MQEYAENLKIIAKKYSSSIEFSKLDELFVIAEKQITNNQIDDALQTISDIKQTIIDINNEIRQYASQQEQSSAKEYAQKYLDQLDRLIENVKKQGLSNDIINKLEVARENLSSATDPSKIIKQIREIISIKEQFELTKNDLIESRIIHIESVLFKLSYSDRINQTNLENTKQKLQTIKDHLSSGEYEIADKLLQSLEILEQIKN